MRPVSKTICITLLLFLAAAVAAQAIVDTVSSGQESIQDNFSEEKGQNLFALETHPEGSSGKDFLTTLEEMLYLNIHVGLASTSLRSLRIRGQIAQFMSCWPARGNHLSLVYPARATRAAA